MHCAAAGLHTVKGAVLIAQQVCYDLFVTFDCAYVTVYFRYLFMGFERIVVGK